MLHVPPVVASVRYKEASRHILLLPPIAAGAGDTVKTDVVEQPVAELVKVITEVPEAIADTSPVVFIVAMVPLPLAQVPGVLKSLSEVVNPGHTVKVPAIPAGSAFIVATAVIIQPNGEVYSMVDVPVIRPDNTPVEPFIVATLVFVLTHVPPVVASVNRAAVAGHIAKVPLIAAGNGLTVTVVVTIHPVGNT